MWKAIRDAEGRRGVRLRRCSTSCAAREQPLADADEQRFEHGLLRGEVAVDRRTAHPGRRAEVFDGDAVEAALGEQPGGRVEQRGTAVGLGLAALRGPARVLRAGICASTRSRQNAKRCSPRSPISARS